MANEPWDTNLGDELFSNLAVPGDTIDTSKPQSIGYEEEDESWQDELRRDETILGETKPKPIGKGRKPTQQHESSHDTGRWVSLEHTVKEPTVDASLDSFFAPEAGDQFDEPVVDQGVAEPSFEQPFDDPFESQHTGETDFDISSIDIDGTIEHAQQSKKRTSRVIGIVTALGVIVGIILGINWLMTFNAQRGIADVDDGTDTSFIAEPQQVEANNVAGEYRVNGTPVWELDEEEAKLMSVYGAGVLQIHDGEVKLRNINTGKVIQRTNIDEAIEATYETVDAKGNPAVGYQTDTAITIISRTGVESWDTPEEFKLIASGDIGLLVDSHSRTAKAVVPGEEDLVDAAYDPNLMLSGADQGHLLQPISNTPRVELVEFDGADREVLELVAPHEKMSFIRHLSIGHGISLALWELDGVKLATTHSLKDGQPISTVPIESAESWSIGRGADLAVMGRYALEMSTGHFITEADRPLSGAVNTVPFIEEAGNRILIIDGKPLRQTSRLRGVTESAVVIENGDSSISVYPHTGSPDKTTHGGGLA